METEGLSGDVLGQVAARQAEVQCRLLGLVAPMMVDAEQRPFRSALLAIPRVILMLPKALRLFSRLPDEATTRRLYREATGFDHDRATADMNAVRDRLALLNLAPEQLVRDVASWIVTWVANGRPAHGPGHDMVETEFAALVELEPDDESFLARAEAYRKAWNAFLGAN